MYNLSANFQSADSSNGKPEGLWVSIKGPDDWPHWCIANDYRKDRLALCHRVELDLANVLVIDTEKKLKDFALQYHVWNNRRGNGIHWPRVAKDYAGIIVAPYFGNLRHTLDWYWGWDCASGCIWLAKKIVRWIGVEIHYDGLAKYRREKWKT
jgi:hypothetical protein